MILLNLPSMSMHSGLRGSSNSIICYLSYQEKGYIHVPPCSNYEMKLPGGLGTSHTSIQRMDESYPTVKFYTFGCKCSVWRVSLNLHFEHLVCPHGQFSLLRCKAMRKYASDHTFFFQKRDYFLYLGWGGTLPNINGYRSSFQPYKTYRGFFVFVFLLSQYSYLKQKWGLIAIYMLWVTHFPWPGKNNPHVRKK